MLKLKGKNKNLKLFVIINFFLRRPLQGTTAV